MLMAPLLSPLLLLMLVLVVRLMVRMFPMLLMPTLTTTVVLQRTASESGVEKCPRSQTCSTSLQSQLRRLERAVSSYVKAVNLLNVGGRRSLKQSKREGAKTGSGAKGKMSPWCFVPVARGRSLVGFGCRGIERGC